MGHRPSRAQLTETKLGSKIVGCDKGHNSFWGLDRRFDVVYEIGTTGDAHTFQRGAKDIVRADAHSRNHQIHESIREGFILYGVTDENFLRQLLLLEHPW